MVEISGYVELISLLLPLEGGTIFPREIFAPQFSPLVEDNEGCLLIGSCWFLDKWFRWLYILTPAPLLLFPKGRRMD
jgi:hypothetical protein